MSADLPTEGLLDDLENNDLDSILSKVEAKGSFAKLGRGYGGMLGLGVAGNGLIPSPKISNPFAGRECDKCKPEK